MQQKEVLLRDPYEYIPAIAYLAVAVLLIIASELAFAVPVVAFTIAALFLVRSAVLFRRGYRIRRYQKNLTRLAMYRMHARDLPVSDKVQMLGMGFEWSAIHTQRVYDLSQLKNRKYKKLPASYRLIRSLELKLEKVKSMGWLVRFTSAAGP